MSRVYATKWGKAAIAAAIGAAALGGAATVSAASLSTTQISAISSLLQSFNVSSSTIANVQAVLSGQTTVSGLVSSGAIDASMIGQMRQGAKGDGVCLLQTLLAADPNIYPEGTVSCYFGPLTAKALKKFQGKHGIEAVGFIGPKTLAKLEEALKNTPLSLEDTALASSDGAVVIKGQHGRKRVCAIVPPGHLIAPGWLKKHGNQAPVVPQCQVLPPGILKKIGGHSSTTALSITSVSASSVSTTGATISWTTNIGATTQVEYGTTTSYGNTTSLNSALVTSHSVTLTGLQPDTTYHYRVRSTVGSTTAVSSDHTFTTN